MLLNDTKKFTLKIKLTSMERICLPERREVAQVAQHGLQQKVADIAAIHKIVQILMHRKLKGER